MSDKSGIPRLSRKQRDQNSRPAMLAFTVVGIVAGWALSINQIAATVGIALFGLLGMAVGVGAGSLANLYLDHRLRDKST